MKKLKNLMSQNLQEVMMINRKINILMFALVMGILILPLAASRNSYAQEEGSEQERTTTRNKHIRERWESLTPQQKQELKARFKGRQEGFKGRGRNGPDRLKRRDQINEYLNKNDNSFREKGDRFDSDGAGRGSNNQSKPGKND